MNTYELVVDDRQVDWIIAALRHFQATITRGSILDLDNSIADIAAEHGAFPTSKQLDDLVATINEDSAIPQFDGIGV